MSQRHCPSKLDREVRDMLKEHGFELVRQERHFVFRRESDGATVVVTVSPRSPSDQRNYVRQSIARANRRPA